MKITKFVPEYDSETRRNNWSMEVVADGRTWTLKGCTTPDGTHSFGVTRAKDNLPYGVHYASQMAREIREFVIETLDADLLMRERLLTPTDVSASEPEYQHPILTLETRAVLAHLVEELQAEFFTREAEAREAHYEMTSLEATTEYAAARGFESAIEYLMQELQSITGSKEQVDDITSKRRVCELDPRFREFDLVLDAIGKTRTV